MAGQLAGHLVSVCVPHRGRAEEVVETWMPDGKIDGVAQRYLCRSATMYLLFTT